MNPSEPFKLQSIAGRYWIETVHQTGGQAIVVRAIDRLPDNPSSRYGVPVAIKLYRIRKDDHVTLARLISEVTALKTLDHPHIVRYRDHGIVVGDDGEDGTGATWIQCFVVMDLIEDEISLREFVVKYRPIDAIRVVKLMLPIVNALCHVHETGFIHGDITENNIRIRDAEGACVPILIDFGLARRVLNDTLPSGTPEYMAPEQAGERESARVVGPEVDIWSIGVVLFLLVTGELPFGQRGKDIGRFLNRVKYLRVPFRRLNKSACPKPLRAVIRRCLEKDQTLRWSISDLERHLQGFAKGGARYPVPSVSLWERGRSWQRVYPRLSGAFTGGLAAALVLLVILLVREHQVGQQLAEENRQKTAALIQKESATQRANREAEAARIAEHAAEQVSYADRMVLAQQALESGQKRRAIDLLETALVGPGKTDWRGFEWGCLWHLAHSDLTAFQGHEDLVDCVAFSPDGQRLASSSWDATVRIWNASDGREQVVIQTGEQRPYFAWSPDGTQIAAGLNRVGIWSSQNGALVRRLPEGPKRSVNCFAFAPNSSLLAVGQRDESGEGKHSITLFDVAQGQVAGELIGHTGAVRCLAFSSDGRTLVSGAEDQRIIVWSLKDRIILHSLEGHTGVVSGLAFGPEESGLVSVSWDGTVRTWDTHAWQFRAVYPLGIGMLRAVALSRDGQLIATGGESGQLLCIDAQSGLQIGPILSHPGMIWSIAASPDGVRLASGGERPRVLGDGTAFGAGGIIKLWDVEKHQEIEPAARWLDRASQQIRPPTWVNTLAEFPASRTLVTGLEDGSLQTWRWNEDRFVPHSSVPAHKGRVKAIAAIPSRDQLASAGVDGEIQLRKVPDFSLHDAPRQHGAEVLALASSADGRSLVSSGWDHRVILWRTDAPDPRWVINIGPEPVFAVALSPDGARLATGHRAGVVTIRSIETGTVVEEYRPHQSDVTVLAFSANGQWLLSGSTDRTAYAQPIGGGRKPLRLTGHTNEIHSIALTADSRRIATSSWDRTVKLWDVATGLELLTLRGASHPLGPLVCTADGRKILVSVLEYRGVRQGLVLSWRSADPEEIWESVLRRHPLTSAADDEELTLVRCAWTLANQSPFMGTVTDDQRARWLASADEVLAKRVARSPQDKRTSEWRLQSASRREKLMSVSTTPSTVLAPK